MTYDSKAERHFHARNSVLAHNEKGAFFGGDGKKFFDADGQGKRAKVDFFDYSNGIYLEFKAAPLNFVRTIAESEEKLGQAMAAIAKNGGGNRAQRKAQLQYGWNHSAYKQASVIQQAHESMGLTMIVVFADDVELTADRRRGDEGFKEYQSRLNEVLGADNWCFEWELPRVRGHVQQVLEGCSTFGDMVRAVGSKHTVSVKEALEK